jgi:hypothetical protein
MRGDVREATGKAARHRRDRLRDGSSNRRSPRPAHGARYGRRSHGEKGPGVRAAGDRLESGSDLHRLHPGWAAGLDPADSELRHPARRDLRRRELNRPLAPAVPGRCACTSRRVGDRCRRRRRPHGPRGTVPGAEERSGLGLRRGTLPGPGRPGEGPRHPSGRVGRPRPVGHPRERRIERSGASVQAGLSPW